MTYCFGETAAAPSGGGESMDQQQQYQAKRKMSEMGEVQQDSELLQEAGDQAEPMQQQQHQPGGWLESEEEDAPTGMNR